LDTANNQCEMDFNGTKDQPPKTMMKIVVAEWQPRTSISTNTTIEMIIDYPQIKPQRT